MNHHTTKKSKHFKKILIASRGEIAVRIIKTLQKLHIESVAIFTAEESDALHVQMANEAYQLTGDDPLSAFLDVHQIINIAQKSGAEAIHPGYGFLSENPIFAQLCSDNNIQFIGPSAQNIALMGDKVAALTMAKEAKVPVINGAMGSIEDILKESKSLQFPLLVKPAFGGGGKGMVLVQKLEHLETALHRATDEAMRYFSNPTLLVEHFIESPRHIEIQIVGDNFGNIIHLFERECSVQRRFQKIIEETPAPNLAIEKRDAIIADALKLAHQIKYTNAGTVEFLVDKEGNHFFIEMNTRIQVEHPITEEVTGVDIVELQISIAANKPLSLHQKEIKQNGFALECRINAENPNENFTPSPGDVFWLNRSDFSHIRIDTALKNHSKITPAFDSLIAKVITHGQSREDAINQMVKTLNKLAIKNKHNNIHYLKNILQNPHFKSGDYNTTFCSHYNETLLLKGETATFEPHLFQIGWAILRLKKYLHYSLSAAKTPLSSLFNFWVESEFGTSHLLIRWINPSKLEITLDGNESLVIEQLYLTDNSIHYSINNHIYNILYLKTQKDYLLSLDQQFMHLWEHGIKPHKPIEESVDLDQLNELKTTIPCRIVDVLVACGQDVKVGDSLVIIEAMKMQNTLKAWKNGVVSDISITAGVAVKSDMVILKLNS